MRSCNIHHVDSFTNKIFGGNPTVTVLEADTLTDNEMRQIANEMNLSETGFVLQSNVADFRLRFFTPPGDEIKFCGHATVGALYSIAYEGLYNCKKEGKTHYKVETNAGILTMSIDLSNPENPQFIFDAPPINLVKAPYHLDEVLNALEIPRDLIDETKPLMLEKTNNYLYFTAKDLEALGKITPNMPQAINFAKKDKIVVYCALTQETFEKDYHIHTRGFAPLVGVPEDPFTGSMQGGAAAYAVENKLVAKDSSWIHSEQGHFMKRPGFVKMEVISHNPFHVKLHAEAVHVFSSKLTLK